MSDERRRNFRFTLQPELRDARLKIAGKKLSAEIVEQSSGGFRVEVPLGTKVALNDVIELETWAGTCQALVAYVDDTSKFRRIGLQRISDEIPSYTRWLRFPWRATQFGRATQAAKAGARRRYIRFALGAGIGLALLSATWLFDRMRGEASVRDNPMARQTTKDELAESPSPAAADGNENDSTASPPQQPSSVRTPEKSLATLERLVALQSPKMVADLELSEGQKLEISRLLADTSSALARLQSRRGAKNQAERLEKIGTLAAKSEARALEILTQQQRAKWRPAFPARSAANGTSAAVATSSTAN